ncbi:MAG: PorT family protein [Saprospiraceae bacterium]|nr:PorT family protein [Saprospiraceae bacterium]
MKNNLDKHIDSKLKDCFDSLQMNAPDHLWDSISSKLSKEHLLDDSIDEKLEKSYSNVTQKTAPSFLWDSINDELYSEEETFDDSLDHKLKYSYQNQEAAQAPNKVWYAISQQLNIDATWNKISKALDINPVISDWRNRMFKFMAVASILFLFVRSCDYNPKPLNTDYIPIVQDGLQKDIKRIKMPIQKTNKVNNITIKSKNENEIISVKTQNNNNETNFDLNESPIVQTENIEIKTNKQKSTSDINIAHSHANLSSLKDSKKDHNLLVDDFDKNLNNGASIAISGQSSVIGFNSDPLYIINDRQLSVTNDIGPVLIIDEFGLENKRTPNNIKGKFEAGVFTVINSTMLLNKETKEGFDKNSLVQNYYGLAANYGLWASYKIIPHGAIIAEFSINADNRQAYGVYENGVYYLKEWLMKYNRVSLAYKHDLWRTNHNKILNTKIVAQIGTYLGFLREAKLFYDGDLRYDRLQDHHHFDFGFKIAVGQEIIIDKFVIGLGLRSDIGLTNIFRGNTSFTAQENHTNIIQLGGYCTIGYRF